MKILVVSPYPVFPLKAGGKIRTVQLARSLSNLGLDITVVTPFHFTQKNRFFENERFSLVQVLYPFIHAPLLTDTLFPYAYITSFHPGLSVFMHNYFSRYDIYQFEHAQFASLVDLIPEDKPIIYDAHNVEFDYVSDECQGNFKTKIVGNRIFNKESKLVNRAAHILTCSPGDKKRLCELYHIDDSKVSLVPNGISCTEENKNYNSAELPVHYYDLPQYSRWFIFSGSDVEHNKIAVRFILEKLASNFHDYAFILHGACGKGLDKQPLKNVFIDLNPENFKFYVRPNSIGLNPVTTGSGTNLKVIYYLSYGMHVISTPFGMRGYEDLFSHVRIASLNDFSKYLSTEDFPPLPSKQFLQEKYGWEKSAQSMKQIYESF